MSRTSSLRGSRTTSRTQNADTTASAMTACRRSQCAPALYSAISRAVKAPKPSDAPQMKNGSESRPVTTRKTPSGARRRNASASPARK